MVAGSVLGKIRALVAVAAVVLSGFAIALFVAGSPAAHADTAPPAGTPSTVSDDALPTVQQNGVIWSQVTVGNTVYAAGSFSQTWPAGAAKTAANYTPRANLLAFDITTGQLTSFNHTLNAQALAIAASPDGTRIYVGGDFTTVDGSSRYRIAAFDTATGALITTFAPVVSGRVAAIAATNTTVYVGGTFFTVNGVARTRLAAFNASNGALTSWAPTADDSGVTALLVTPDQSEVVVGGSFSTLNGVAATGIGAVTTATGATVPYAINQYVHDCNSLTANCYAANPPPKGVTPGAAIDTLSTDGNLVYGAGYSWYNGNLEGTFGVDPDTGAVHFINDCHGDTYSTFPVAGALYAVGHIHSCQWIGAFPNTNPWTFHHALAFSTTPSTTNTGPDDYGWNYAGQPATSVLQWFPTFTIGTYTGQSQAAWSVTGNSNYIALGGEFPSVNGVAQQGIVRFAISSKAPNKMGPVYNAAMNPSAVSLSPGTIRLAWQSTWDPDNANLTYRVYRDSATNLVYSTTQNSNFWTLPSMGFTDSGLTPGSTHKYFVQAVDPFGNTKTSSTVTATVTSTAPSQYVTDVLGDGASNFWRFNEASGSTAYDWAGYSDLAEGTGVTEGAAGPLNDSATAATFSGNATSGGASTQSAVAGPNTFSIEAWFDTTSTKGGKIVGFGDQPQGTLSSNYDRQIYMDNAGHVVFGVYNNGSYTVPSSTTYNDGNWHYVVAELSSAGMSMYIDGKLIGQNTGTTTAQPYSGYWRVGGDNLGGWPSQPTSNYFAGAIGDVAIYPSVLTTAQVQKHFTDSGRTLPIQPAPTDSYGTAVYASNPLFYWRVNEANGPTAIDTSPNMINGTYSGGVTYQTPSNVSGTTGTAVTLDGSTGLITSSQAFNNPTVYSEEMWFKTTTTSGGRLIGFGNQPTGYSSNYDRQVWMLNTGQLEFGTYTGQTNTITSPASYNDGNWHYLVATQGPDGMTLYVDGVSVGTNPQTGAQNYTGYWRVGGDNTWGGNSSNYFAGAVDEIAIYNSELTASQVKAHYVASPAAVVSGPTAAFTPTCTGLVCSFDASASTDAFGTITGYAWSFGDSTTGTGVTASHTYTSGGTYPVTLTVTDSLGKTATVQQTIQPLPLPADAYGRAVLGTNPSFYWRLDDANGPTAADASINDIPGTYSGGVTYQVPSTVTGPNGTGVTLDGSTGLVTSSQTFDNPTVYSESLWFKTATTNGGLLIGFGDQPTADSSNYDRQVRMLNSGQLQFGTWTGQQNVATSTASYNDGNWHYLVATQGPDGMTLYVDGQSVATNPQTGAQAYTGYWRVGGDSTWGGNNSNYFAGEVDEVAVYNSTELTAAQVTSLYQSSPLGHPAPVAAFTSSCTLLTCNFDASSSTATGTIASYAWSFGDTTSGSGVTVSHGYPTSGTYSVSLTVTDSTGATNTSTQTVTVSGPQPPTAAFTQNCSYLACAFNGSTSSGQGGATITGYAWNFGDNTTGTGATPSHTYTAAGTYTVTLTVTDSNNSTATTSTAVTVTAPPAAPVAVISQNCPALTCSFDGSGSTATGGATITGYAWNFGDGTTGTGATPSHTYQAAGDYTVTLTVTDSNSQSGTTSQTASPRPPANPNIPTYATDTFNRTVAGGWGNATTGGAWTPIGSTSRLSVAPSAGDLKLTGPGISTGAYLAGVSSTDTSTLVTLTTDAAASGNGILLDVIGRRINANTDYRGRLLVAASGAVTEQLVQFNGGAQTTLVSKALAGVTFAPGMLLNVQLQVTGTSPTTINMKVWPSTTSQPTAWQVSATSTTAALQVAGSVGLSGYLAGNATASPVNVLASGFSTGPTTGLPTAQFAAACSAMNCSVDANASTDPSGTISSYQWSWGDGTVTTGVTSTHQYAAAGTYRITLTATDASGYTAVATQTVTVPA